LELLVVAIDSIWGLLLTLEVKAIAIGSVWGLLLTLELKAIAIGPATSTFLEVVVEEFEEEHMIIIKFSCVSSANSTNRWGAPIRRIAEDSLKL
jgi:hypothetical protein